ncbi:hypothetical protein MBLNU13_g02491t2 [Cladosporium sp. NU13]
MPSTTGLVERHLRDTHSSSPAPPKKSRLRGPLRDLDLDNVLDEPAVETSMEGTGREASVDTQPRHATRSTINGRADVNYSQKYHPMDEVTRPRRAARITGSRPPTSFAETSDEEEPELSSGESSDADEPSEGSNTPATRTPDPRAVRHSSRAQAQKQVNYSKAHHPQDWAISGYRRSAKRKRRGLSPDKPRKKTKKQATPVSPIALSSDKTSDDDSSDSDDDEPPANHPSTNAASPSRSQADSPDAYHVHGDGFDPQSPNGGSVPPLPRDVTSFNRADAIVQGSYISCERHSSKAAAEQSDSGKSANDEPEMNFAHASTRGTGKAMSSLIDGVAMPDATDSDSTKSGHATPGVPIVAPPATTAPTALVTPASMVSPNNVCTQVRTQLAISRPYMATQPKSFPQPNPSNINEEMSTPGQARTSSNEENLQKYDQAKPFDQPFFKVSTASVQSSSSSDAGERPLGGVDLSPAEQQRDGFSDAARKAMRDASEDAARIARAKEVTNQLSSGILSQTHTSQQSIDTGTANVSRQVSCDTLPDDHGPSFFDEAMAGTQTHSQTDRDDDPQRPPNNGYSELPVSERERSDTSVSQEQPNSDGQHDYNVSGGVDHHVPTETANTEQPGGSDRHLERQPQSSATLPKSTDTEARCDAAGEAAALTHSEDTRPLQPSSV